MKSVTKSLLKYIFYKIICPSLYTILTCFKPINKRKIVFIEASSDKLTNSLYTLFVTLKNTNKYQIKLFYLNQNRIGLVKRQIRDLNLIFLISDAKLIFVDDTCITLGAFNIRKGCSLVQTWHACGPFKKFGWSTADLIFGGSRSEPLKYPAHKNYSLVTVGSAAAVSPYCEAFRQSKEKVLPLGISRTDVFFNPETIESARRKIIDHIPASSNKKILLFAPTFRGRVHSATTINSINIELLYAFLNKEYLLLIKEHPFVRNRTIIPDKCQSFAFDVSDLFSIDELLCVADVCITDYSSLIFEFSLFEKPMIFFPMDIEEYQNWRGFYFPYDEFVPGPIVKDNFELIEAIKSSNSFNKEKVLAFKNTFMSACDGKSTSRILNWLKEQGALF